MAFHFHVAMVVHHGVFAVGLLSAAADKRHQRDGKRHYGKST